MSDTLKLIGGIGLDLSQLMQDSNAMSRIFGKQYKLMISTQGYDAVKKQLSDLISMNEKLKKQNSVILKQTIDDRGIQTTKTKNPSGATRTQVFNTNTGEIVREIHDADNALVELNKSYDKIKRAQTEIGQIQKQYAGRENEMPKALRQRLDLLNRVYAVEIAAANIQTTNVKDQERLNNLLEDRRRTQAQIDGKTEKVTQKSEIEKVNALYAEQSRVVKEIGELQRDMFRAGPKERKVIEQTLSSRQQELAQIQQQISQSGYQNSEKELEIAKQNTAEAEKTAQFEAKQNDQRVRGKQVLDTMYRTMVAMLTIQAVRMLRDSWREAVSFVKEYYDALNEIRIVTGYSEEQADKLGDRYLQLSDKMKVSALDIAKMGATLYRQGLQGDDAVIGRMEAVLKYAKIAGEDVSQSADIMVVAINAFQRNGEDAADTAMRVADTWTYMGDAVETEAGEIGHAMQKVVANAKVVGLSLEKTSSFIATISSATREAPEVVGTALNRIIARYEKLTQAGMNKIFTSEEGETVAVNDVARALKVIDVELYKAGEGFMSFGDVMDKVGAKWKDLSDVEQRYLATAMAGIHGINKFYALMEDYDKSLALYEGALDARGSADAKYAIYMESVAAAQADMKNSLQALYNTLLSGGIIKDFYGWIAGFVDTIKSGIDAIGGFNIQMIATVGTTLAVVVALGKMIKVFSDIKKVGGLASLFGGGSFRTILVALTALAGVIISIAGKIREASDPIKSFGEEMQRLSDGQAAWNKRIDELDEYKTALESLAASSKDTAGYQETYNRLMENLVSNTPTLTSALRNAQGGWVDLERSIAAVNEQMERNAQLRDLEARSNAFRVLQSFPAEVKDTIQGLKNAQDLLALVQAMQYLKDNPDAKKFVDSLYLFGNAPGMDDIAKFTKEQKAAYEAQSRVSAFASYTGALELVAPYYQFTEDVRSNMQANKLIGIIGEDLDLALGVAETLFARATTDMKAKALSFQDSLTTVFSTVPGYAEASSFTKDAITKAAQSYVEEFASLDFASLSSDEYTDKVKKLSSQAAKAAEEIIKNEDKIMADAIAKGRSATKPYIYKNLSEEMLSRFGENLIGTQKALEENFPKGYAEKYWEQFISMMFAGATDKVLDDALMKDQTPFEFVKKRTMELFLKKANELGYSQGAIKSAYDKIGSTQLDLLGEEIKGLGSLSGLLLGDVTNAQFDNVLSQLEDAEGGFSQFSAVWTEMQNLPQTNPFEGATESVKTISEIYNELRSVSTDGKVLKATKDLMALFNNVTNVDQMKAAASAAKDMFENVIPPELQEDVATLFPDFDIFLEDVELGRHSLESFGDYLKTAQKNIGDLDFKILTDSISEMEGSGKIINGVADALRGIRTGGKDAVDAIIALRNTMSTYADAQIAYNKITKEGGVLTEDTAEYFDTLASYTGIPVDLLSKDLSLANDKLKAEMDQIKETMELLAQDVDGPGAVALKSIIGLFELITGSSFGVAATFDDIANAIYGMSDAAAITVDSWFSRLKKLNAEIKKITEGSFTGMKQDMYREGGSYDKAKSLVPYMKNMADREGGDYYDSLNTFKEEIRSIPQEELEVLKTQFPELGAIIDAVFSNSAVSAEQLKYAIEKIQTSLDDIDAGKVADDFAKLEDSEKIMQGTYQALEDIKKGGLKGQKALQDMGKRASAYAKAQGAANKIMEDGGKLTDENKEYFDILASHVGMTAEELNENMNPALQYLQYEGTSLIGTMQMLAGTVAQAGGVNFNTAGWQTALAGMDGQTNASIALLQALYAAVAGAGKMSLTATQLPDGSVKFDASVPSLALPAKKSGGGGGGGGKGEAEVSKGIQSFLDNLSKRKELDDFTQEIINLRKNYHELRGEISAVIALTKQEISHIQKVAAADDKTEASLRTQIEEKQQQIAGMKAGSKQYKQAVADLEALQEAHKEYSKRVIENKSDLEELQQAIKDLRNEIRDMEIELREELKQAFEDREELEQSMLDGRVEMEDQILSLIEERYQREQELINENLSKQREAYNEELKMLRDNLNERKRIADEEKKAEKLAELENQMVMISADPTRAKERLDLQKQIASLREEIAWDIAENEVKAQEDSINQQIDSLDEYQEYIDKYYENLFDNPVEMIREMESVMKLSDTEIIAWLKASSEEFKNASENKQLQMAQSWTETLMTMHGQTVSYWNEIEEIIKQGDNAIIAFLTENSADYKEAGALQAEAYVDEWLKKLSDLKAALLEIDTAIDPSLEELHEPVETITVEEPEKGKKTYTASYTNPKSGTVYTVSSTISQEDANKKALERQRGLANLGGQPIQEKTVKPSVKVQKFAKGGYVDYTGIAAVHGSKAAPEAFLSSVDTKMVRGLLDAFRVIVPRFSGVNAPSVGNDGAINIEEIIVNVERLDNDTDLEELANRVGEKFAKALTTKRGTSIGNVRIK